jgi:hypothetical protein
MSEPRPTPPPRFYTWWTNDPPLPIYLNMYNIFVEINNCDTFINSIYYYFFLLNIIYISIRIVHINNISVYIFK